ncbi:MAG: M48 family metallopeptidase [Candidatus Rokuibacteriota bacterium]
MTWTGHYLDGRSADRRRATVRLTATGLEITTDGGATRRWPYAEIRQTQGSYTGEPVRLERGGEAAESLTIDDVSLLTALRQAAPRRRARFHDPRPRRLRIPLTLAAGLAAIGLAAILYRWAIPAMAGVAAWFVPVAWEVRVGDAVFDRMARPESRCKDPERQRVIDTILARVVEKQGTGPYHLRVTVMDGREVNAFALPGGQIVLLRGLLDITDSPEMLAGVLAHEVQHVLRRHTTRAIIQHASTGLMVAAIAGDVSGLVAFALEGARVVGALGYSRRAEEEADAEGMRMLLEAGIDPSGFITFFENLGRQRESVELHGVWRYLSTHPSGGDRVETLRGLARGAASPPVRLMPNYDWKDVKRICSVA